MSDLLEGRKCFYFFKARDVAIGLDRQPGGRAQRADAISALKPPELWAFVIVFRQGSY